MSDADGRPTDIAERLRPAIGNLVRETRRVDELSPRFAQVLGQLDRRGPLSQGDLAELQAVRQQSMSATLGELVEAGYVKRRPDPADGRRVVFALDAKGRRRLAGERRRRVAALAEKVSTRLTDAEREALAKAVPLLERLGEPDDER